MSSTDPTILQTIQSLIEVESTNDHPERLRQIIAQVRDFFSGLPVTLHEFEYEGYPSLAITTRPTMSPQILLHGHLDVVPGLPEQFRPHTDNGQLFGRGAVDMKGFVGVAMHVLRDLAALPSPPDVGLMINTDEEIGGRNGAKQMVLAGWSPGQLINGDGGYGDAVTFAQKGIIQLTVECHVEPGSRNTPWNGRGAAEQLVAHLARGLKELCPRQDELTELENWGSTATVLSIESRSTDNLPPRTATASVRLYWAGEQSGAEVIEMAQSVFHPMAVSGVVEGERVYLSRTDPDLLHLQKLWQHHLGRPIGFRADNGSSDAKWFAPLGIPILILRFPGDGAHQDLEWLELSAIEPMYKTLHQYIIDKQPSAAPLLRRPSNCSSGRAVSNKS